MKRNYQAPEYSKNQVKKAGEAICSSDISREDYNHALLIANNWRAAHAYPLQSLYVSIKRAGDASFLYAQRMKRMDSITRKLKRWTRMKLTSMQDLGGCRVVVNNLQELYAFVDKLKSIKWNHALREEYNYIDNPKEDGYRCYHLVYSFQSKNKAEYNGMLIEVQIRTQVQHLWATAVETMDEIDNDHLKNGEGKEENKKFFVLASQLLQMY